MDWYGTLEEHSTHSIEAECTQVTEGSYVNILLSFLDYVCDIMYVFMSVSVYLL